MRPSHYGPLAAEFYQLTKPPHADYPDVDYYLERLAQGRSLEVGVGTGRLLLPLLEAGIDIEGLDSSREMLQHCRKNAEAWGLEPKLYAQDLLAETALPQGFDSVIVSMGSFQIFADRAEALLALQRLHGLLRPQGRLYVDLDLPKWDLARSGQLMHGTLIAGEEAGTELLLQGSRTYSQAEQIESILLRYERWRGGKLVDTELQQLRLRSYGLYEFASLLREQGFDNVEHCVDFDPETLDPTDFHERLCFSAHRK